MAAVSPAALHKPGEPAGVVSGAGAAGVDVAGAEDGVEADGVGDGLADGLAGAAVVVWDCGWLGPHA
ncbi:MAG: hypothetical protein ACLGH7_02260, partial [Actinomycetes bacterium]